MVLVLSPPPSRRHRDPRVRHRAGRRFPPPRIRLPAARRALADMVGATQAATGGAAALGVGRGGLRRRLLRQPRVPRLRAVDVASGGRRVRILEDPVHRRSRITVRRRTRRALSPGLPPP